MNRIVAAAVVALASLSTAHRADAQEATWPNRPIRFIVAGGTGGVPDLRARWLADKLSPVLHQPIVVEDKPGAGGNLAMEQGAHSAPDGYTFIVIHQGVMTINPHLFARPGYDPLRDFTPVNRLGVAPLLLAVSADSPVRSVSDLIELAKARPGQLSFGSNGIGTPPHLAGELFKRAAEIDIIHVPYKGGGQSVSDLIAGHITMTIEGLTVQLPHVRNGRLRALAVTGSKRVDSLPDVPTMQEAGVRGYTYIGWVGVAAPAGISSAIVQRMSNEISKITTSEEGRAWFAEVGAEPGASSPEEFSAAIRAEYARWDKLIKESGIHVD